MSLRRLKKILRNRDSINIKYLFTDFEQLMYDYYNKAKLFNKSHKTRVCNRIIDDTFYITTQYSVGYVNRSDYSLDRKRLYFSDKNKYMLYEESLDAVTNDTFKYVERPICHISNLKSAVNWVGRYGDPYGEKVQYYYISKGYVYRIWNSTHLTGESCNKLFLNK